MASQMFRMDARSTTLSLSQEVSVYYSGPTSETPHIKTGEYFRSIVFRNCMSTNCGKQLYKDAEWEFLKGLSEANTDILIVNQNTFTKPKLCLACAKKVHAIRQRYRSDYTEFDVTENQILRKVYEKVT